jgi:hypothetical protein
MAPNPEPILANPPMDATDPAGNASPGTKERRGAMIVLVQQKFA